MNKEVAVKELIKKIYDYTGHLVISKKDLKKVEQYYIKHSENCSSIKELLVLDKSIESIVMKLKSGKDEIDKQLRNNKALQPAILAECVFVQTLSKILGLRSYIDLENTNWAKVPLELNQYINPSANTICAARYVYYNKNDYNTLIIQYGNPKGADAATILYTNEIIIEIKDMPALLMDTDLTYDEEGKLIIPFELEEKYPDYTKYIKSFNKETSIFNNFGSNYPIFDKNSSDVDRISLLRGFFDSTNIDIILTSIGKKDDLIAIKSSDIDFVFPDGTPLIYTFGSEIRTTGKNARAQAFTPNYLEAVLKDKDVIVDKEGICRIYHINNKVIGKKSGRGKDKSVPTRFKISHAFFVKMKDVKEFDDYIEFPKNKIQQSKSGISLHIEIKKTKQDIKTYLYK